MLHSRKELQERPRYLRKTTIKLSHRVEDVVSFIHWLEELRDRLEGTVLSNFIEVDLALMLSDESDESDKSYKSGKFGEGCKQLKYDEEESKYLNHVIMSSVDDNISKLLSMNRTPNENVNTLKKFFAEEINISLFMKYENDLWFDPNDLIGFLNHMGMLSSIYYVSFGRYPDDNLKLSWIMNALNKNMPTNGELLGNIHSEWGQISQSPSLVRQYLVRYCRSYRKKSRTLTTP